MDSLCDLSCDSLDLDSVSQVSLAESSPGPEDRERMFKCVSSENISRAGDTSPSYRKDTGSLNNNTYFWAI